MKIRRLLLAFATVVALSVTSCKDEDSYNGCYCKDPYVYDEEVAYTVRDWVKTDENDSALMDIARTRLRPTLASQIYPAGDHGIATRYGFCVNHKGNPTVYDCDTIIYIDESWPDAVLSLQKGILKDTTYFYCEAFKNDTVYVRSFMVPYTTGNDALTDDPTIAYSQQSVLENCVIK